jgi:alpha-tubulin suppressor-like RCC1 family protein
MTRLLKCLWISVCALIAGSTLAQAGPIGAGAQHTVVRTPDGLVWTWGGNGFGQLGDGTTTPHTTPATVPSLSGVTDVAAGANHTLVLKSDGSVWSWGSNTYGQLGDGSTTQRTEPVAVAGLSNVVAIAAGANHSVALTSDGHVWTWGRNTNGQLDDGTTTLSKQPLVVSTSWTASAIGAGADHTLVVKTDNTVWGWGANANGQLGDGSTTQRTSPVQMTSVTGATSVAGGGSHSLVLKSDGTVRATGYNFYGMLGDGTTTQRTSSVAVSTITGITAIAAGGSHSYARKSDGTVFGWGFNGNGQVGDGTTTQRNSPTALTTLSSMSLIAAGQNHGIAVSSTAVVWVWGTNANGQIGDGTTTQRNTPIAISDADYAWKVGTPVFSVAGGSYTTEKTVAVTCATTGATVHYTLDGATPTESDPTIASGSSLTIDQTRTLKALAWKTGLGASNLASAIYTLSVAAPSFSPAGGTYTTPKTVTISTTSPGATIRYTLDGSTPTEASAVYASPLEIGTSTSVKAIGLRTNWTSSAVASATYTMNFGTLAAPTISPGTGTYTSEATVTLTAMSGATIRYTTNGSHADGVVDRVYRAPCHRHHGDDQGEGLSSGLHHERGICGDLHDRGGGADADAHGGHVPGRTAHHHLERDGRCDDHLHAERLGADDHRSGGADERHAGHGELHAEGEGVEDGRDRERRRFGGVSGVRHGDASARGGRRYILAAAARRLRVVGVGLQRQRATR